MAEDQVANSTGDAAASSRPARAGGRRNAGPDATSMGLPHFCRARHYVRGANVFIVPVWDLPSRWCPDEVKRNAASSSSSSLPVVAANAVAIAEDGEDPDESCEDGHGNVAARGDDEDSGSESEHSEIGWEGALGSESRLWSRASVEGALLLIRHVQSPAARTAGDGEANSTATSTYGIALSAALFAPEAVTNGSDGLLDRRLLDVLSDREPTWAVCALRSGHFAGAVFRGTEPVIHKAIHRYTIRAKSGGSQAAQDSSGKKTKSAGSTLRRYGQQRLAEEIHELMTDKWSVELNSCSIIFVSVSKRMRATLLGTESKPFVPYSKVRKLPFMTGKPTFEAIKEAHVRVAGVVFADASTADVLEKPFRPVANPSPEVSAAPFEPAPRGAAAEKKEEEAIPILRYSEEDDILFTPLHAAAAANDEEKILDMLESGADPTARDGKGRVPFYLCSAQRAREAFRRWRGSNEDEWDWHAAQVPEGITEDTEQKKKDKEKEKKKKQKEKQKANKAKAKEEEEERQKKEEEEVRALEAAQVKCDSCKKPITAKPFSRLDFMYCSTDCVSAHRRELQAEAALKRFG